MTTQTWSTPLLPLMGLSGIITNGTPTLIPDLPVTSPISTCWAGVSHATDKCANEKNGPGCPVCPQVTNNPPCSCKKWCANPMGCSQANLWSFDCTSQCQKINEPAACPNGTYNSFTKSGNSVSAVCNYVPAANNLGWFTTQQPSGSGFPAPFYIGMIQRYALSQYIASWNTQLFEDTNGTSFFHQNVDYTSHDQNAIFRQILLTSINNIPQVIPSPSAFQTMLKNAVEYPYLMYSPQGGSGGSFSMLFYSYGSGLNINPSDNDISSYLQSMTMERPEDVGNLAPFLSSPSNTCPPVSSNACQFAVSQSGGLPSDLTTNPWYIFVDLTTYKVYNVNVPPSQLQTIAQVRASGLQNDDFYVIGRIYNVVVQKLSPIVTYLFSRTFVNLPFDKLGDGGMCDRIQHDTTQVPSKCYKNTCQTTFSGNCKSIMTTYCQVDSIPNKWEAMNCSVCDFSDFFLTSNADQCMCYESSLSPPALGGDIPPAMCFTTYCTQKPELMKGFGLTDAYCSQYCGEVYDWLNDPDPARRSANPYVLDVGQYQRLCGTYTPTKSKINFWVLGAGVILALIVGILTSVISRNIWLGLGLLLGILALGVFLAFDLSGVPYCPTNGNSSACQSSITHLPIPNWFCSYWLGCECGIGKACANPQDQCIAGICIPPQAPPEKPIEPPSGGDPGSPQNVKWRIS